MGMKYIPTVRDQQAAVRFLNKQNKTPNFKKSSDKRALAKIVPPPEPDAPSAPAAQPAPPANPGNA